MRRCSTSSRPSFATWRTSWPCGARAPSRLKGNRVADLEQENKTLRQRVEAARLRVHDLLSRLTFLEEQAREAGGNGGVRSAGGVAPAGGSAPGASGGAL